MGVHRVALVTGAARGLGLELVRRLAELDLRVVLTCRSSDEGRAALERLGGGLADRVAVRPLDVRDDDGVSDLLSWVERRLGRCDVLVNNARLHDDDDGAAAHVPLECVQDTLDTNLLGTWRLVQAAAPLMRRSGYGRIVNVSCGLLGRPHDVAAHRVSTSAVNSLTRVLAAELAGDGILVNACCPALGVDAVGGHGPVTLSMSPETPVWLATLPDDGPTGGFWRSRGLVDE